VDSVTSIIRDAGTRGMSQPPTTAPTIPLRRVGVDGRDEGRHHVDAVLIREIFDCGQRLLPRVAAICGSWCDAEDAISEATFRAIDRLGSGSQIDSPPAWIRAVALNLVRSGARRRATASDACWRLVVEQRDHRAATATGPVDLLDAMRTLSPRQREAIVLRYWYDLPISGVAAEMTVAVGTAKALLHQARCNLKARLDAAAKVE
jgi:RNA polymerase sigma factor (sigma-70 family)